MNIGKEKDYLDNAKKLKFLQTKRQTLKGFSKGCYLSLHDPTTVKIRTDQDHIPFNETHSTIIRKLVEALVQVEIEDNEKAITEITR